MSRETPYSQSTDPFDDAFLFETAIVVNVSNQEWVSYIRNKFPDYVPRTEVNKSTSFRLFYFMTSGTEGLWECFTHMNIASLVPRYIIGSGDRQISTLLRYLVTTIKTLSITPAIANLIGYKGFFYIPSICTDIPGPLKSFDSTKEVVTKTILDNDLYGTYICYKTIFNFDGTWSKSRPQSSDISPGSRWNGSTWETTYNKDRPLSGTMESPHFDFSFESVIKKDKNRRPTPPKSRADRS